MRFFPNCFCVFVFFLLSLSLSAQNVTISDVRITTGAKTMSVLPRGAGAHLCFELKNSGEADQYVIVSIRSEEVAGKDDFFSAEFLAPAKSVQQCQFPFQLDGARSYAISSGDRGEIAEPEITVWPLTEEERLNLTVTDEPFYAGFPSVNSYCGLKGFSGKCLIETVFRNALPAAVHQLVHYGAIQIWDAQILLPGCIRGGLLFEWVPLPGREVPEQQNG